MNLEEKLENITAVELIQLDFNNNIRMEISNTTPRIARDYVRYQSINRTGKIYAPEDEEKITLAKWFINRGCTVRFILNPDNKINLFQKLKSNRKVKRLMLLVREEGQA
jgi:hypothetical protein